MAFSYALYTGDGATANFAVSFPYIQQSDVSVTVNGVSVTFTWLDSTHVTPTVIPALGTLVKVLRSSNRGALNVTWVDGSTIASSSLNTENTQLLYICQESFDSATAAIGLNNSNQFDALNHNIQNLLDPVLLQDAVTLNKLNSVVVAAGNVPAPGVFSPAKYLKALSATTWGWITAALDDLSDIPQKSTSTGVGEFVRVRTDKTAYEYRTPAQMAIDIGTSVAGMTRNAKVVQASSTTATFTADEAVVETSVGGASSRLSALNLTVNLATNGANGMDTGSAPVSADLSIYLIYKPSTGTSALLACAGSTSNGSVYTGANMPALYTQSALISSLKTNVSSQLATFIQLDRKVFFSGVTVLSSGTATSLTSVSLTTAIPANARSIFGYALTPNTTSLTIASDSSGLNAIIMSSGGAWQTSTVFGELPMKTAQTLYYSVGTNNCSIIISSYTF